MVNVVLDAFPSNSDDQRLEISRFRNLFGKAIVDFNIFTSIDEFMPLPV